MTNIPSSRIQAISTARQVLQQGPLYFDTETTGVDRSSEIVEIAIVDDSETTIFETFVKPKQSIPPIVTSIHGITNQMVEHAQSFPIVWQRLRPIMANRIIATYNADFDLQMIKQSYTQYHLPWKDNLHSFCIMKLYAQFRGEWDPSHRSFRLHTLEKAGQDSKIPLPNAHRAVADTLLARALLHFIADQPLE